MANGGWRSENGSVRIGADLVEVSKIARIFAEPELLQTVFTPGELRVCKTRRSQMIHLAVRFAVKEALFKALGTGLSGEMDWRDVEVPSPPAGESKLRIYGRTAQVAQEEGVCECAFSFSHTREVALALVVLVFDDRKKEALLRI